MFKPLPFGSASFFSLVLSNNYILNKQVPVVQQINPTFIRLKVIIIKPFTKSLQKGGVPAAPSGTATLLRLHPPYSAHLRRFFPLRVKPAASGAPNSGGVTGGVYKARERIHRSLADLRLLAIPASCSRVADYNPNWDRL